MNAVEFLRANPDCDITRVLPVLFPCDPDVTEPDCPECGGTGEVTVVDTGGYGRFADCPECGWL